MDKQITKKTISKSTLLFPSFPQSLSGNPRFPVKTGNQFLYIVPCFRRDGAWIPAFAGMTAYEALLMNSLVIDDLTRKN